MAYSAKTEHFTDHNYTTVDVGTVNGLRSFKVDKRGRLKSVIQDSYIWKPGENEAQKHPDPYDYEFNKWMSYHGCGRCNCKKCPPRPKAKETFHGFYSFHDGSDEYRKMTSTVSGVTENYGEVTFGTRGFRSEKAKVVALHIPFWHRPVASRVVAALSIIIGAALIVASSILAFPLYEWVVAVGIVVVAVTLISILVAAIEKEGNPFPEKGGKYDLLRQAYDGKVKFYNSRRKMLRKHPLYKYVPPKINFEDPEYWK